MILNQTPLSQSINNNPLQTAIDKLQLMQALLVHVEGLAVPSWVHNGALKMSKIVNSTEMTLETLQSCSKEMDKIIAELYGIAHVGGRALNP